MKEGRFEGIACEFSQMLISKAEFSLGKLVFLIKRSGKHGGIVCVEGKHQALVKVSLDRMISNFDTTRRAEIAAEADFDGNLALGEFFDQFRILVRGQSVADSLRTEIQRAPDGFRPGILAGMGCEAQPLVFGIGILLTKKLGRAFLFVSPDTDADHVSIAIFCRQLEHSPCRFGTELAHGVEDPEQRYVEICFAALTATFQAFEDGVEVLLAPEAHTD